MSDRRFEIAAQLSRSAAQKYLTLGSLIAATNPAVPSELALSWITTS